MGFRRERLKRRETRNQLRARDTYENTTKTWSSEWGYKTLFSCCSSVSGGVAILFKNNFAFQLERSHSDPKGRSIICDIKTNEKLFTLATKWWRPSFFLSFFCCEGGHVLRWISRTTVNTSLSVDSEIFVFTSQRALTQLWCTLIEIDHLSDWSPEKRTIVSDWRFDNQCESLLNSESSFSQLKIQKPWWAIWLVNRWVAVGKPVMWLAVKTNGEIR